jgi:hypothetical protein
VPGHPHWLRRRLPTPGATSHRDPARKHRVPTRRPPTTDPAWRDDARPGRRASMTDRPKGALLLYLTEGRRTGRGLALAPLPRVAPDRSRGVADTGSTRVPPASGALARTVGRPATVAVARPGPASCPCQGARHPTAAALLDEPLASLDARTRMQVRGDLRRHLASSAVAHPGDLSRDLNDTNPDVHPLGQSATCRGASRPSGRLVYVGSPLPSVIHTNWSSSSGVWAVQIGMTVYKLPGWDWGAGR